MHEMELRIRNMIDDAVSQSMLHSRVLRRNCSVAGASQLPFRGNLFLHTSVFIHTNRRSMVSGILSARHTGSLAFRLQKIFYFHTEPGRSPKS